MTEGCQSTSPVTIAAHQNDIAALALNHHGSLVATASVKVCIVHSAVQIVFFHFKSNRIVFAGMQISFFLNANFSC